MWQKVDTKDYILHDCVNIKVWERKTIGTVIYKIGNGN
jgi:hypothetical protein